MELLGAFPLAKLCRDGCRLDDLDAWKPHPVTGSHLVVHLFHGTIESCVSVLLVHVVITSSALITQPNSIIINLGRILLKNLHTETSKSELPSQLLVCFPFFTTRKTAYELKKNTQRKSSSHHFHVKNYHLIS